jgi:hypothetical protein
VDLGSNPGAPANSREGGAYFLKQVSLAFCGEPVFVSGVKYEGYCCFIGSGSGYPHEIIVAEGVASFVR